ncbi:MULTISPECIES: type I restriction endonuclease subunit R [Corynebacterium]|uniref:type I restriction endonuclease subunit R n=1 Tax=Corynebacterium TaxID=1716 RepID=UPI000666C7DC|nr:MULTISPECIES: type I restriction endonuclease [Corynebacterium]ATZ05334.1 type I restriction endonuclease subunit R [Corynebacterium striatum]EGT5595106.1 type I restriction endonuclease subunit R [Corynebacterium striatum]MDK8877860.1 type I restriction endonuclease [Corynebacterium striatum]NHX54741.1 type I restriction endonuclease subunit R [Corynebacterium striatum]NHY39402.1 type I restriction endonuclease subunit R [Corynebacterium striatum]
MPKRDIMREERLEETICESLKSSGWIYEPGMKDTGWDARLGLFPADVLHWLSTQYPEDYAKAVPQDAPEATRENAQRLLLEYVAKRLESATRKDAQTGRIRGGLLGTLREGFKYAQPNTRSATFGPMVAFPPANPLSVTASKRAEENRLRIIRQVHFDTTSGETLDLVATVNGIPVATFELKTDNTQSVAHAVKQYRKDRVPSKNRRVLLPGRALVHFAVSNDEVYMTTALKGTETRFLPFNQGHDGAGGNPPVAGKSATAYLWERVLRPRLLLRILSDFAVWEPDSKSKRGAKGTLIFPRFHQLRAVEKVTTDVAERGAGGRYLIEHSAGSGKTKTIAWLAHRLIRQVAQDGTKTFDSVIVVTDRTALDTNIRQDMQALAASRGLVVSVGESSGAKSPQLQQALVEGGHIITCTLQTFPYVLSLLDNDPDIQGRNWCVIADEAHSSQTGSSASALRELLAEVELDESEDYTADDLLELRQEAVATASNMTFVALTATPKGKTLRLFGSQTPDGHYIAFDTYPMGQAIAEGFIMDVLTNYSTYTMWAEVRDELGRTEEVDQSAAVTDMVRFVRLHPTSIAQKVEVVVEHYRRNVAHHLDGQARAMVVTSSRKAAVHWAREMNRYITEKGYEFHSLVAFSDKVRMEDEPDPVTEVSINGESDVERAFKDDDLDYRVLIVANKFQTGFNEPRLCAMYVDKHLSGVATVQTLSRLNRIHPNKPAPMVVDFINDPELIEADFKRYYQGAVIDTDIDPNSLHTLADELDTAGYYDPDEMNKVAEAYMAGEDSEKLRGVANTILDRWRTDRNSADKDTRERAKDFRAHVLKYRHAYEFLSQIIAYADADVSRRAMLCSVLEPNLHITELDDGEDFLTGVTLAGVAIALSGVEEDYSVSDGELEPLNVPEFTVRLGEPKTPLRAAFDEAVEKVNDIFSMAGVDVNSDETAQMIVAAWGTLSAQPEAVRLGKENSSEQLKRSRKFQQEATKAIFDGIEQRKQRDALLTTDRDVLKNVVATLAEIMAAANETGELG